jgi:hypothetical protein
MAHPEASQEPVLSGKGDRGTGPPKFLQKVFKYLERVYRLVFGKANIE